MSFSHLTITDLQCHKGGEPLFAPVSLRLKPGQMALLTGANGSGKTTLLEAVSGLAPARHGEVQFGAEHLPAEWFDASHFVAHQLGHKANLNCLENLRFMAEIHHIKGTESHLESILAAAGLAGYEYHFAGDLSAGQKKRLALSRLLLLQKPVWLLDEPFVNLDQSGCDWLYGLIQNHLQQQGAIILTAHDQPRIQEWADHHITLSRPQ